LSTLRAWLFNGDLARRIQDASWLTWQPDDPVLLDGSHSFFRPDAWDDSLQQRLQDGDIHIGAWLWSADHPGLASGPLCQFLARAGFSAETRPLRLLPQQLTVVREDNDCILDFSLPTGAYATSVLRELVLLNDRSLPLSVQGQN